MRVCCYCGHENGQGRHELRPYGPDGADVCAECVICDPKKMEAAKAQFIKKLQGAAKMTSAVLLTTEGPIPYVRKYVGKIEGG